MKYALIKEHTGRKLTGLGRLVVAIVIMVILFGLGRNLYSFLAPEAGPHEGLMVIEGWIHDFALDEAVAMYRTGNYSKIVCAGIPIEVGSYILQYKSYPEMTANRLSKLGVDPEQILIAVSEDPRKDRTYAAAVALREAFITYNLEETNLHLVTTGPHGRRSRMLFQKALGKEFNIGVTCVEEYTYDSATWCTCSEGVRTVTGELIAYLYAKFFFHP